MTRQPMQRPQVVLITGGSRGVGAATARHLAAAKTHVIITYREKKKRAADLIDSITAAGGSATALRLDICDPGACADVIRCVRDDFRHLDALILNASGGLERCADPGYAMRINRDAQVHLVNRALALIPAGGRVVFVTSHQAHFHGVKPVPAEYIPIAHSKRAGEDALRAMRPDLAQRGVSLSVVSGDMIDGSIIVRLLQRQDPDAVEARRAHGPLPTLDEFATAIAAQALDAAPARDTVYIGGADYLETQCPRPPRPLPVADAVAAYRLIQQRVDALVRGRHDVADLRVPACPAWNVRHAIAHLAGVAEDITSHNLEGKGTCAWAQAQVQRLGTRSIDDLLDLWAQLIERITATLELAPPASVCQLVLDTLTHEHDIRGAVNEPVCRAGDPACAPALTFITIMGDQFIRHAGLPALQLTTPTTGPVQLGDPHTAPSHLVLSISDFEALRAFGGRRSVRQLRALPWQGDPTPLLPAFTEQLPAFTHDGIRPPVDDLIE
jgi:3-oxoacyl-[acyl-carrier protein] reductase